MRLTIHFSFEGKKKNILPIDYRRGFISILKKALEKSDSSLFKQFFNNAKFKPYTFSIFFDKGFAIDKENLVLESSDIYFTLSVLDYNPDVFISFYNGFLKIRKFPFYKGSLTLKDLTLNKDKKFIENSALFITRTPCMMKDIKTNNYLLPDNKVFEKNVNSYTNLFYNFIYEKSENFEIKIEMHSFKKIVVKHMGGCLDAFTGQFVVKGDPKILKFIYDAGFGIRSSQGFGFLEVL